MTHRRDMKVELVTITRMLLGLPPAVKGELPAPTEATEKPAEPEAATSEAAET